MTTTVQSEYRNLPLASLSESASNPRRSFDEAALNELADFVPLTVMCPTAYSAALQPGSSFRTGTYL